jgi:hypothetical protein
MKRMAEESGSARKAPNLEDIHKRVQEIAGLPSGQGRYVNGFSVHNMGDRGIRVRMPGKTQFYKDPREAAVAAFRKEHHEEGHSPITLPGVETGPGSPPLRETKKLEDVFRGTAGNAPPKVIHPRKLDIAQSASKGVDRNKTMRQKVLHASTIQGQVTPELVGKTEVTITRAPHGRRGGSTLASHSGQQNTLHIKPEVLVGSNAEQVRAANVGGWWVPTDSKHDLATNVMIHEYGHGVHGMLIKNGVMEANKLRPYANSKTEMAFWTKLADSMGVPRPHVMIDKYIPAGEPGHEFMNIVDWHKQNNAAIKMATSRYAGTNINEMMAELWTEGTLSSNPRAGAKFLASFVKAKGEK